MKIRNIISFLLLSCFISFTQASYDFSDAYTYMGNPQSCQIIKFRCEEGYEYFSDENGCGCVKTQTFDCEGYENPVCGVPVFTCPEGAMCMMPLPVNYTNMCELRKNNAQLKYFGTCKVPAETLTLAEQTVLESFINERMDVFSQKYPVIEQKLRINQALFSFDVLAAQSVGLQKKISNALLVFFEKFYNSL